MAAYYNEIDHFAAEWLRQLIKAGHIAPGDVDERSIEDVTPNDLADYQQCHFFAGIGGWSYALRLAGWPDDLPVWTGSVPCQPFSAAGKRGGVADERHLWPAFYWLIRQCRPAVIFGEQVASKAGLEWWDVVATDLENAAYACAAADIPAAGVGAPHIRQRLYWFAHNLLGDANGAGLQINPRQRQNAQQKQQTVIRAGWASFEWLACRDGKARPTQPGLFPLAHGIPGRVGRLRGYGNAIVPQVAATFIEAYISLAAATTSMDDDKETR